MNTFIDVPAGTEQARAGLNFTRVNGNGGIAADEDTALRVLIDGRYIADVWEAVPGSWSTTGVAGYQTRFAGPVDAEDAVIAAYHQLTVLADYEIDVLHAKVWHTVFVGRTGVDADRLSALGAKAREIAAEYHALRNVPVRVTLWSTTAPTSRVTTYAEYRQEEPMTEQPGQPGQPDPLTADPLTDAAGPANPVNLDWSTLGQSDRVWRVNPATGQPQGLTIDTVNADTVTGQLDDGPTVTLPLTDIQGEADWSAVEVPPWKPMSPADALALLETAASAARAWKQRIESGEVQVGVHLDGSPATANLTPIWMIEDEGWRVSAGKRLAMLPELLRMARDPNIELHVIDPKAGGQVEAWRRPPGQRDGRRGDDLPWPDPDARPRW